MPHADAADDRTPARRPGSPRSEPASFWDQIQTGFRWVDENPGAVGRFFDDVQRRVSDEDNPWRYLLDRVNAVTAISMQIGLVAEQRLASPLRGETLSLLIGNAMCDAELLAMLSELVARSPTSIVRKEQLVEGIDQV